jgi:hypothetical protein
MTINPKKDWATLFFFGIFIPLTIFKSSKKLYSWTHFDNMDAIDYIMGAILLFLIIYAVRQIIWALTGLVTIKVSNDNLTIDKKIMGISRTKNYELTKISDIYILTNTDSNSYRNFGGVKLYDNIKKKFSFTYLAKTISIGKNLTDFDADKLKHEITKRQ